MNGFFNQKINLFGFIFYLIYFYDQFWILILFCVLFFLSL